MGILLKAEAMMNYFYKKDSMQSCIIANLNKGHSVKTVIGKCYNPLYILYLTHRFLDMIG